MSYVLDFFSSCLWELKDSSFLVGFIIFLCLASMKGGRLVGLT